MPRQEAPIVNKLGLHARASAKLTQTASAYACDVWLERNGKRVNAKSIMGVMMLAAAKGSTIVIGRVAARWNRMIFYDGRLFHSSDITDPAKLNDPMGMGRLTVNGFFTCTRPAQ